MNKGQVQQVFIYMMVLIVVGAMLIIGFRSITNIMDRGCQLELTRFEGQLRGDLQRNTRFGFVQQIGMSAPCDYHQICFGYGDFQDNVINASVSAESENIFLRRGSITEPLMYFENLNNSDNYGVCVNRTAGRFEFVLAGVGGGIVNVSAIR